MQQFLQKHSWSILAAGAAIQILTGIPAAWGAFQPFVQAEYGLSEGATSFVLSSMVAAFGAGGLLGGLLQDKAGPRLAALCGTALLAGGFCAAGALPAGAAWLFYLAFAAPVGLGCAFLYPAVMGCAQKWFAQNKGLATGVIGGAVGFSGAVLSGLVRWLAGGWGIRACFFAMGGLLLAVCGAGSLLLQNPAKTFTKSTKANFTPAQMLKTRQYWLVLGSVALATPAVLLFSPILIRLGQQRGLAESAAALSIGVGSVGSAAGRLCSAAATDRWGQKKVNLVLFAGLFLASIAFAFAQGYWFVAVYALLCFCYAGEAAVLPSLCTNLFGLQNTGLNYGFLALGAGVGSLGFPLLAGAFAAQTAAHAIAVAAAAAGFLLLCFLRPTAKEGRPC